MGAGSGEETMEEANEEEKGVYTSSQLFCEFILILIHPLQDLNVQ